MCRLLALIVLLIVTLNISRAGDSTVAGFEYELSINSRTDWKNYYGVAVKHSILNFSGGSLAKIPGDAVCYPVHMMISSTAHGIEAIAAKETALTPKPFYPQERSERFFQFDIRSLKLPPNGQIELSLNFKDATDVYVLRYREGQGLRLEAEDVHLGKIVMATVPEFVNLTQTEGKYVWQCNPLTISASKDGDPLWSKDTPMQGQPESISIVGKVLFIKTSRGHSFYVLKDTGELVFYDNSVMKGERPSDDIRALWRRDMGLTFSEREKRGFFRFIKAAVLLDDKESIPLLIQCVEDGQGLGEKCAAIAALEKFNGNPNLWPQTLPPPSSFFLKSVGMNRVFPENNAKAERKKWEEVFKDQLPH